MFLSLGNISGIIVAGGYEISAVDFLTGDLKITQLPDLPQTINGSSIVAHFGTILLCGGLGNSDKCLQLDHGNWKNHSTFVRRRDWHSAVTTQAATFVFGGGYSRTTYDYLPKDSTEWIMGKTEIPGRGFEDGYAITAG